MDTKKWHDRVIGDLRDFNDHPLDRRRIYKLVYDVRHEHPETNDIARPDVEDIKLLAREANANFVDRVVEIYETALEMLDYLSDNRLIS